MNHGSGEGRREADEATRIETARKETDNPMGYRLDAGNFSFNPCASRRGAFGAGGKRARQ